MQAAPKVRPTRGDPYVERLELLVEGAEAALVQAESEGQFAAFIAAVKELRALFEAIARSTGELTPASLVEVVNIQASAEWTVIRTVLFEELADRPDVRHRVVERLLALERPDPRQGPVAEIVTGERAGSASCRILPGPSFFGDRP